ncbi:hypothetical protein MKZ38_008327 [Zalerion maritima]|uniref:Uncharacterized protein n=1 Tax=Zalerion maritima TaxID=339359 RepID=A0AAD5RH86_9PEZI|nr:hypothetical protein MKZ38_008327 [Zalerion maritima]
MTSATKEKITITGVQATLMMCVACRLRDNNNPVPLLEDPVALSTAGQIDYDWDALHISDINAARMVLRSRQMDRYTGDFIAANPRCTVLHLACGLDARAQRLALGPGVRWIDSDLPDVVELRRRLVPEPEGMIDYQLLSTDILEAGWLDSTPTDRPLAVVFEGLTMYLAEDTMRDFVSGILEHFRKHQLGGQLIFDALGSRVVDRQDSIGWGKTLSMSGARFTWAMNGGDQLEKWFPGRVKLKKEAGSGDFDFPTGTYVPMFSRFLLRLMQMLNDMTYMVVYDVVSE